MSLLISLVLILIAGFLSIFVGGLLHLGHLFAIAPLWLEGILLAGVLSLFIRDNR